MLENASQSDKYEFYQLQRRSDPPMAKVLIAGYLGMSIDSLYTLVSRERKIRADQVEIIKNYETVISGIIKSINLVEFKEYLRKHPNYGSNRYLLNQLEGNRKPLQSNTIKILESIRDMLNQSEV